MKEIKTMACRTPASCAVAAACGLLLLASSQVGAAQEQVIGLMPLTSVLIINEADGVAELEVSNANAFPSLLHTTVHELADPHERQPRIHVLQPVLRVEPRSRVKVRFALDFTSATAPGPSVQSMQRIWLETIPPRNRSKSDDVALNIRYDIPVLINPKGLSPNERPWEQLKFCIEDGALVALNGSRHVVRAQSAVELLPALQSVVLIAANAILPGQRVRAPLPDGRLAHGATAVRIHPVTTWGIALRDGYDIALTSGCTAPAPAADRKEVAP